VIELRKFAAPTRSIDSDIAKCKESLQQPPDSIEVELSALFGRLLSRLQPGTYTVGPDKCYGPPLAYGGTVHFAILDGEKPDCDLLLVLVVTCKGPDLEEAISRLKEYLKE